MKKFLFLIGCLLCCVSVVNAQQNDSLASSKNIVQDGTPQPKFDKSSLIPTFTATVLARYEFNTELYTSHFELRHTRIGMYGSPHRMFSYMALVDLSYGGKFSPVASSARL